MPVSTETLLLDVRIHLPGRQCAEMAYTSQNCALCSPRLCWLRHCASSRAVIRVESTLPAPSFLRPGSVMERSLSPFPFTFPRTVAASVSRLSFPSCMCPQDVTVLLIFKMIPSPLPPWALTLRVSVRRCSSHSLPGEAALLQLGSTVLTVRKKDVLSIHSPVSGPHSTFRG